LYDYCRIPKYFTARNRLNAAADVLLIRESGLNARRSLDNNLEFQLDQRFARPRRQRDATLAPERFARNTDNERDETPP
jgi:hypothetical protein